LKTVIIKSSLRNLFPMLLSLTALLFSGPPAGAIIDVTLQMQLGNPSGATADSNNHDHYLIQRPVEAMDYSDNLGEPIWVSWDLTTSDVGNITRSGSYFTDTNLPPGFYRVTDNDYNGVGNINFNRGHMCPSVDRTDSRADNDMLFFMSNIIPQAAVNNQTVWGDFEGDCRNLAAAGNELLIICGPSGFGTNRIPSGKAAIANYTWKIVAVVPLGAGTALSRITAATRVISLKIPNSNSVSSSWSNYVTSANQIQVDTGLTFFTALSPAIASSLRGKVDGQVNPAPGIISFSPTSGAVGASILITGTNFGSASTVAFNGASAVFNLDSATQITATVPANATSGQISITTPSGTAISSGSFTVNNSVGAPTITTQPLSQNVAVGLNATFQVSASGSAPFSYQWQLAGTNLPGASLSSYTRTNVQAGDVGNYSVIVTNNYGLATSSNAFLNVGTPPGISGQPQDVTVNVGQSAGFTVNATGTAPLAYQWKFNGADIPGATTSGYTLLNAQGGNVGNYSVGVTNLFGSTLSSNGVLAVIGGASPAGIIAQWTFNNTNVSALSPLPSKGTGTISLLNLSGSTPAAYVSGSASDTNATNFGWNTLNYPAAGMSNKTAGVLYKVSTLGYQNIALSWDQRLSATASKYFRLQYTTNGTSFIDYNLITMGGNGSYETKTNNFSALPGVENNPNFAFRIVSEFESTAIGSANASYVTTSASSYGTAGTVRYDVVTIFGTPIPSGVAPTITAEPQDTNVVAGANATFSVTATGTAPFSYQWQLANTNLPTATNATLTLTNVAANQAGTYRVVVTNNAGLVVSSNAVMSVYATAAATLSSSTYSGNQFQLGITGVPGHGYAVQGSTNLVDWVWLQTNAAPFSFIDTNTAGFPLRFYRAVHLP
jgi:DNA/RNA endonuclease G (NUC1)